MEDSIFGKVESEKGEDEANPNQIIEAGKEDPNFFSFHEYNKSDTKDFNKVGLFA